MPNPPPDKVLLEKYYALSGNEREALDESLWDVMPFDWPGRDVVDLGNLGDSSAWMDENLGEPPAPVLLDGIANVSGGLAEEYTSAIQSQGYSVPSDFDEKSDSLDDLASIQADFRRFLVAWREKAMPILLQHLGN